MIAQIGPLVQVGKRNQTVAAHLAGGFAGGAVLGLAVASVGAFVNVVFESPVSFTTVLIAGLLCTAILSDASFITLPNIGTDRQTPGTWKCVFGDRPAVFAWGFDLGLGITTRIRSVGLLALPVYALLGGNFVAAVLAFVAFGATRSLVTVAVALRHGHDAVEVSHCLGDHHRTLGLLSSAASLTALVALSIPWM